MKAAAIVVALACLLIGWWTASLPNTSQKAPGLIMIGYGILILGLVFFANKAVLKLFLIVPFVLALVAYSLPMTFWESVGLAESQPPEE